MIHHSQIHHSQIHHAQYLLDSYREVVGGELILRSGSPEDDAQLLFTAPFVVVSHGGQADPIFNYGNQTALDLWEFDWDTFTQLPSRLSAEPENQADRDRVLQAAQTNGYIQNYQGIRISKTGKQFWIENVTLWTVKDAQHRAIGQAATFSHWQFIA
jgi:MEKHLA domain